MTEIMERVEDLVTSESYRHDLLMEKLSEFLAVEKGGVKLYEKALLIVKDAQVHDKFVEFLDQTRKHEEILTRVIRELGGDPNFISAGAKVADAKAQALLKTMDGEGLTPKDAELNAIENIVIAETKDQADWELLGRIARRTNDTKLSTVLKPAVKEVEPQEDEHLTWTKQQMSRLAVEMLSRSG
jgi:rubrerythrin